MEQDPPLAKRQKTTHRRYTFECPENDSSPPGYKRYVSKRFMFTKCSMKRWWHQFKLRVKEGFGFGITLDRAIRKYRNPLSSHEQYLIRLSMALRIRTAYDVYLYKLQGM